MYRLFFFCGTTLCNRETRDDSAALARLQLAAFDPPSLRPASQQQLGLALPPQQQGLQVKPPPKEDHSSEYDLLIETPSEDGESAAERRSSACQAPGAAAPWAMHAEEDGIGIVSWQELDESPGESGGNSMEERQCSVRSLEWVNPASLATQEWLVESEVCGSWALGSMPWS